MEAQARQRRSQQERSAAARRRLCEATIEALARHGYRGTTTQRVAELAELSRGAMQHHYASRVDLVADAAEHLLNGALARTIEAARRLQPGSADPFRILVGELWQRLASDWRYDASLELFVALRSDAELRARVQPMMGRLADALAEGIGGLFRARRPGDDPELLVRMTFTLLRGLALEAPVQRDPAVLRRMLDQWADLLGDRLRLAGEAEV
ncbi:MAG: TetR/AcrR family transcriptional regulator [Allosphingosinicella sp.]|uniref:TetR/AcrR family transcriptional regulator n=1 Tax=Allosphingosinicella sp. TaxID=2823234 RepID=UPI003956BC53